MAHYSLFIIKKGHYSLIIIPHPDPPERMGQISAWRTYSIVAQKKVGPPLENVGPTLDPWKSIVFSVIKPLDALDL